MRIVGRDPTSGATLAVTIHGDRIAGIEAIPEPAEHWIAPALIDIQVNGFAGFDFNAAAPEPEIVAGAIAALHGTGVGLCCPTITTGSFGQIRRAARAVVEATEQDASVGRAIAGIHLEGPYISPLEGPRGAHPLPAIRPPDWEEFQYFQEAARGTIRLVTLAPELPGALDLIERLCAAGIVVALGHHAATAAELDAAVRAGATLCTHLGNGAHAQLARHPNYIWEQLGDDRLQASFILDGHHLPPAVVRCMLRAKGIARSILVSDAMFLAGQAPRAAAFMGLAVELTPEGRVNLAGTPYLAGSALSMADGVGNAVRFGAATLAEALRMATVNPATVLGLADRWGTLAPGRPADLLLFSLSAGEPLRIEAVLAAGAVVVGKVPA